MGIVIKQSAISTALTYAGVGIGYINLLILYPKYMSPEEVGLARIVQDAALLLVPIAQIGVSQLIVRYFPQHHEKPQYKEFVGLVFSILIVALIIFTVFFFIFQANIEGYFVEKAPQVAQYLSYILGLVFILTIYNVLVAFSQSSLNIVLPYFLKEILLRALTLVGIVLFATQMINFNEFIILLLIAYFINLTILIIYLRLKGILKMEFNRSYFNTRIIKEMLTYGSFTFLGASGILIIGKVDSIMVASILGLRDLAIYSIAIYIAVLIELPKRAVSHISMPLLSRAFKDGDHKQTADLYRKSAINNLIIGLLIFIGLWINLESLYSLIPRSEIYTIGSMVVIIIGAGKLIDMAAGLNGELIVMSKFYKVNVYLIVGLSFITVVANYYLIPIYGINGAAAGSALALFLFNLSKFIFIYHKLKLQPFSLNTLKVLLIGGSILYVGLELPRLENIYLDILYRSSLVTIIYVIANFILRTSTEVNAIIRGLLKR